MEPKPAPSELAWASDAEAKPVLPPVRTRVEPDDDAGTPPAPVPASRRPATPRPCRIASPAEPKPAPPEPALEADAEEEPGPLPGRRRLAIIGVTGTAALVLLIASFVANTRAGTAAGTANTPAAKVPLPPAPPVDHHPALVRSVGPAAKAPPADPDAVPAATAAELEISTREAEMLATLKSLDLILQEWKPGDLRQEHRAIAEYKKVVQSLRAFADRLIRGHGNANKTLQGYRAALEVAPEKLDAAATEYARYAAEETTEPLKSHYAAMGEKAKEFAAKYATRAKALTLTEAELSAKMEFVRRSRVFLDRLDAYLDLLAAGQGDAAELQKYLEQLNQYIGHFETSLKQFKLVTDRIAAPPPAATVPPKK